MGTKVEIYDISVELKKLAKSGVIRPHTATACKQAADLLVQMREIILTESDAAVVHEKLRWLLAKQGEG
jgi:hypothetical protein